MMLNTYTDKDISSTLSRANLSKKIASKCLDFLLENEFIEMNDNDEGKRVYILCNVYYVSSITYSI